jgi:ABC-type enterochelin transport system substrate-binding protein
MTPQSNLQTELEKKIRPVIDAIQKDHDVQLPVLRALVDRLSKAIDKLDGPAIQSLRAPFDQHVKLAGQLVVRASKAEEALKKLSPRAPEDVKAVQVQAAKLQKLEKVLQQNLLNLKGGQDKVQDALDKANGVAQRFAEDWARLDDLFERHLANCHWRVKQVTACIEKAKAAVGDRDRVKLQELIAAAPKFRPGVPGHSEAQQAWREFQAKIGRSALDANARDQLGRELPKLKSVFDTTASMEEQIARLHHELEALKITAPDRKKAAAHLKVPAATLPLFSDALGLKISSMEKYMDEVGKSLKPARSGKQVIDELKKAKHL